MNTTPRTDSQLSRYYDDAKGVRIEYVTARFTRQLERELNQRNAQIKELREALQLMTRIVANGSSPAQGGNDPWEWIYMKELKQARTALENAR